MNVITPQVYLEMYGAPARDRLALFVAEAKASDPLIAVTVAVPTQYAGLSLRRSLDLQIRLPDVQGASGIQEPRPMFCSRRFHHVPHR